MRLVPCKWPSPPSFVAACLISAAAAATWAQPAVSLIAPLSPLQIEIEVASPQGQLLVSLCSKARFLEANCETKKTAAIQLPITQVNLVPPGPGRYAVTVVQDVNSNGKMDTNFLGIPTEPVGLSRNPPAPSFGPPKFEDAAFNYSGTETVNFSVKLGRADDVKGDAK
jgi:uncharacterized protein (DUF2141 family)